MRFAAKVIVASLLSGVGPASAQISVTTDPVGYVEVNLAANAYTFIGLPLYTTVAFKGAVTGVSASTLSFEGSPFDSLSFGSATIGAEQVPQYFIEVTSGSDVGAMIPILSNTANTVALTEDVSSFIAVSDTITIRPLHTLDSLFPNGAPLRVGVSVAAADEVLIFDASQQATVSYFYSSTHSQWRRGTTPNGSRSILPNQSIYINHKAAATKLVISGTVKLGTTGIDVLTGYNLIPNPFPFAYPLSLSDLYTGSVTTGLKGGVSVAAADLVTIYSGSSVPKTYYFHTPSSQWRTGTTPSDNAMIPVGGALMIHRKSPSPPFTWVKSQPF